MALIRMNHLSFCKGRQTDVSVILPTKGMEDKRNGTSFETPGMKYQTLWLLHGGGGDDMDFVKYSNIVLCRGKSTGSGYAGGRMLFSSAHRADRGTRHILHISATGRRGL